MNHHTITTFPLGELDVPSPYAVEISGKWLAVASQSEGAVSVYGLGQDGWQLQTRLTDEGNKSFAVTGVDLAFKGEQLLAVGLPIEGKVMVFENTAGQWNLKATLGPPSPSRGAGAPSSGFGASVAFSAGHLVVGAPRERESIHSGAVYTFPLAFDSPGTLIPVPVEAAKAQNPEVVINHFGMNVAADGEWMAVTPLNALRVFDGEPDPHASSPPVLFYQFRNGSWELEEWFVVDRHYELNIYSLEMKPGWAIVGGDSLASSGGGGRSRGIVHIIQLQPEGWQANATLFSKDGSVEDDFGSATAWFHDTIIVGAPTDSSTCEAGNIYAFSWSYAEEPDYWDFGTIHDPIHNVEGWHLANRLEPGGQWSSAATEGGGYGDYIAASDELIAVAAPDAGKIFFYGKMGQQAFSDSWTD